MLVFLGLFLTLGWVSSERSRSDAVGLVPQTSNSISGHVSGDLRTPLPDLRVELLNEVDTVIQVAKTDASGLFVFRKLSDGAFQVRVQASSTNYIGQTKRVELARPRGGFGAASEEVDFVLITRRTTSPAQKPGVVFLQEVPAQARKEYQRAAELLPKSEKRQEALEALKKAIEIYPQYFDALEMLGSEYVKHQDYEFAVPLLTKALEINARAYPSWYALGVAQYNLKQQPAAIESLKRAVSLNPKSINATLWLGMVLRRTGRLDEAETHLKQANVLADAKLPDAHWELALLFNQLKRFREAADELERFLKVQPDSQDAQQITKLIQQLRQQSATGNKPD